MLSQNRSLKMQSASPSSSASANTTTNTDAHLHAQLELLSKHTTPNSSDNATVPSRGARSQAPRPQSASPAHGYSNGSNSPPSDVLPPIVNNNNTTTAADPEAHIHPELRARIINTPAVNMMPAGPAPPQQTAPSATTAGPSSAPPATLPAPTAMALDDGGAGSKAKRELSQSKRAAQNRAAQRAFRQRKEHYIKKLEQQVRDYMEMEQSYKTMQSENYALREYVIHLQSRLLDAQGEIPQPPPNVNLANPPMQPPPPPASAPEAAPPNPAAGTPLEAVAQAVAGLAAQEQLAGRQQFSPEQGKEEERREGEEMDSELQADGLPAAPTASM